MKKILLLSLFLSAFISLFGQSQGISYQAVLINDNDKEIPGIDVQGNYLPNQALTLRFSIIDANGVIDYQEEQQTATDGYGMINLVIGWGTATSLSPGSFSDIDWNGSPKDLRVEISLGDLSSDFAEFSQENLTFVPYAFHRNITATGSMIIDGPTDLNNSLNVNNNSPANLSGTLSVDGITDLNSDLNVNNGSAAYFSGDLSVLGQTTLEDVDLKTLNSVSDEATFVATFENTNNGNGDGIKIKLGKRATKNDPDAQAADATVKAFLGELSQAELDAMTGILDGNLSSSDLIYLTQLAVPTTEDALALAATACELTETIGNSLINFLNTELSLPVTIGPYGVSVAGVGYDVVPELTLVPTIPSINLPCDALGTGFELPSINFTDISDPLNKENLFIEFTDNNDFSMGAIKAQSIENWTVQYLDPVFLYDLYLAFKGLDKSKILPTVHLKGLQTAKSYLAIGVQYSSGNGDYAEWLERIDRNEKIGAGDIVGVIGGKITKDLTNAEQVMAVSHHPIVLGNTPKAGEEYLGNNVAFMGQIPVKIMGPVNSGDYIVGKGEIPGYGFAISPNDIKPDDLKYLVGRSWETNNF
ncbi:MAG: hypothetical protein P1P88_22830, partial [Bacteroidales bacterium]|nr:hypothetical protein [Bacteroidales bacterium]